MTQMDIKRLIAGFALSSAALAALAADPVLTGAIRAAGKPLDGATVSAKRGGSTITTSVYTDKPGRYVSPPLPAGSYRVWAQALGFGTANGEVELGASSTPRAKQDFTLQAISDP